MRDLGHKTQQEDNGLMEITLAQTKEIQKEAKLLWICRSPNQRLNLKKLVELLKQKD